MNKEPVGFIAVCRCGAVISYMKNDSVNFSDQLHLIHDIWDWLIIGKQIHPTSVEKENIHIGVCHCESEEDG